MNSYNGFSPQQRTAAQKWLNKAWAAGTLPRPSKCHGCGQTDGPIDAHAEDYSTPFGPHLQAFELCYLCHIMLHCRFRSPGAWNRYRDVIRAGRRYRPQGRNFNAVKRLLNGEVLPYDTCDPPSPPALDQVP